MEISAKAKYIHMSPRKLGLVAGLLRGLSVVEAEEQLAVVRKLAARPLNKLIASAVANAHNSFNLDKGDLFIKEIKIGPGPTLHRWRARAFGRVGRIRKRTAHIYLILGVKKDKVDKVVKTVKSDKLEKPKVVSDLKSAVTVAVGDKPAAAKAETLPAAKDGAVSGKAPTMPVGEEVKKSPDKKQSQSQGKKGFVKKIFSRKVG